MTRSQHLALIGALVFSLSLFSGVAGAASAPAARVKTPLVTWTPGEVDYTIGNGTAADPVVVTFVSTKRLKRVRLRVTRSLKGFVTVGPNRIPVVQPNVPTSVTLYFSIPPKAAQGVYVGSLVLRRRGRGARQRLKISVNVDYAGNIVAPTTDVLSPEVGQYLSSISPDRSTLTFARSTAEIAVLKPGSVLVLGITANAPHGFIGRVTSVTKNGAGVVVKTVPASLADAFTSAHMTVSRSITAPGAKRLSAAAVSLPLPGFDKPFDEVLFHNDNGDVTAYGSVSVDSWLDLGISINPFSFKCVANTTLTGDLAVNSTLEFASFSQEVDIGDYLLPDFVVWVGFVPVVFTPEIALSAGADGDVSAGLNMSATQIATLSAGIQYGNDGWQPVSSFSKTFSFQLPDASVEASAKGFVEPQLNLLIYDAAGPYVDAQPYVELDVTYLPLEYWLLNWQLFGGLDVGVGIDTTVLGDAANYSDPTLISYQVPLATGTIVLPTPTPTATPTIAPTPAATPTPTPTAAVTPTPTSSASVTPTATPTATATPNWTQQQPANPPPERWGGAMTYDPPTGNIVLFGGGNPSTINNETWAFDGTTWTQLHPANSPSERNYFGMTYDAARKAVTLFGGCEWCGGGGFLNDTWTWDGTNWSQQNPATSPPGRDGFPLAYDAGHQNILLFGGQPAPGADMADTWTWDGSNWTQQNPATSPSPRNGHSVAYDAANQTVVLFGGNDASGLFDDTWLWNGANWIQQFPATSPPARSGATMIYDPVLSGLVLFGGQGQNGLLNDTWLWNGNNWTQLSPATSPASRYDYQMDFDGQTDQLVLYGGTGQSVGFDDTWTFGLP
jgi:Galactose oxidase, central domain